MAWIQLPDEFKEFLKCLNSSRADYLVIGGFAVNFHGYHRNTNDIDIWVRASQSNAKRVVAALREFGFPRNSLKLALFSKPDQLIRIGVPPLRIEIMTSISGVTFADCFSNRVVHKVDDTEVPLIGFQDLRANKKASGRGKDLVDLEHLGPPKPKREPPVRPRRPKL